MKVTSRETYRVVRAMLELKEFTQYAISKQEKVTFSLVNKVVNWFVSRGFAAKRKGKYALVSPAAVFGLFPLYRRMAPSMTFDVNLSRNRVLDLLRGKSALCLSSALSNYDGYYRDPAIYAYVTDKRVVEELKGFSRGFTHVELFEVDLSGSDFVLVNGRKISSATRTVIDLFCANKAYAAQRLVKREWG